jgi:peptidoglycan/LPS O-acetylase OafA/YrhL
MTASSSMPAASIHAYRPHIDGLRAIAVLSVVLYHAGSIIPGGFVGVDVFFVISGFLIISQIVEDQRHGTFSFKTFWARRALRILPPYLLVIVASMVIASFVLLTNEEIREFGKQVRASGLMVANHHFLVDQGYFDGAADLKPLLHLWSLAVEEQFYLAAPLILAALAALSKRRVPVAPLVIALFVASLAACIYFTGRNEEKNPAFFLMPLRAWEFMAGGAIGFVVPYMRRVPPGTIDGLGLAALVGLALSLVFLNPLIPFPSFYAVFPVLATAALIATSECRPDNLAARLLSLPPLVAIGLVSYSWYLWHWPLMAFARIYNFGELPRSWALAAAVMSLLLAALTYWLLEQPIKAWRRSAQIDRSWSPVWSGLVACSLIVFVGMKITARTYASSIGEHNYPAGPCALMTARSAEPCAALANGRPIGLLIGDSHARALWRAVETQATASGYHLATAIRGACIGLIDVTMYDSRGRKIREKCISDRANAHKIAKQGLSPDFAIVASRWSNAGRLAAGSGTTPSDNQHDAFVAAVKHMVSELRAAGVRRILVLGAVPEFRRDPSTCVIRAAHFQMDIAQQCGRKRSTIDRATATITSRLKEAIGDDRDVRLIDMVTPLCDTNVCRPDLPDGTVLYRDTFHLNKKGIAYLVKSHANDFDWLMPPVGGSAQPAP